MKVRKVEIMIIDFDRLSEEEITDVIENVRYPNHCISPYVMDIKTVDIGEWSDDNPLNSEDTSKAEFKRLFEGK